MTWYDVHRVDQWGGALYRLEPDGARVLEWRRDPPAPRFGALYAPSLGVALDEARGLFGRIVTASTPPR